MVPHTLDAIIGTEIHDMTFLISGNYLDLKESKSDSIKTSFCL